MFRDMRENTMKKISSFLVTSAIASLFFIGPAGHAHEGHKAEDMVIKDLSNLGTVKFSVSCSKSAQKTINTGVGLLHHMMYAQAEKLFRASMEDEPDCAMMYWGYSMSLFHPLWPDSIKDEALVRGQSAIEKAQQLKATTREKSYINAASKYYQRWNTISDKDRTAKWAKAQSLVY